MPRKRPNLERINRIVGVLLANPEGIWLRKLSREANIPVSTLYYYLDKVLNSFVETLGLTDEKGRFFGIRVIKLKKGIKKSLESGLSVAKLIKLAKTASDLD